MENRNLADDAFDPVSIERSRGLLADEVDDLSDDDMDRIRRHADVSKSKLEGLFVDELALLQPTAGYMRLVKDRVLYVWQQMTSEVKDRAADVEYRVRAIQQKLDRLDEAFLYAQTIDLKSNERQRDRLREELTLAQIDRHAESIEEIDVKGVLAFAERVLPATCRGPMGAGFPRSEAAASAAVPARRHRVRRKSIQSNRRNGTTFQLLGAV
jgi:hypothetical protein